MDFNRFFRNRRALRRSPRLNNRDGEMVDLMQLMRRRLRYRPYVFNRFMFPPIEENLDSNNNIVRREMSNLSESVERQDVSTNTEHLYCTASVLYRNRLENNSTLSETDMQQLAPNHSVVSQRSDVGIVRSGEIENVPSNKEVNEVNEVNKVKEVKRRDSDIVHENLASSSENVCSEVQDALINSISNTTSLDQTSHNSSPGHVNDASEETLASTSTTRTACIEINSDNNSSLSLETNQPSDSTSVDIEAAGDGHHNASVLQFQITLAIPNIEEDNENHENDVQGHGYQDDGENNESKINASQEGQEHNNDDE